MNRKRHDSILGGSLKRSLGMGKLPKRCNHCQSRLVGALFSLAGWFGRGESKAELSERMKQLDYSTSTQRMGLRFNEKVRNVWRFRWLKFKGDFNEPRP